MKLDITNVTHWNTSQLRAFVREGMRRERPLFKGTLRVKIKYNRGGNRRDGCSGCATIGGSWMKLMLPSGTVDRIDLAHVVIHEIAHTAGIEHPIMEGDPLYRRVGNWREIHSWGETLPLEKMVKQKPTVLDKITHGKAMLKQAITRERRATTIRKRWEQRLKRWAKTSEEPVITVSSTTPIEN